MQYISEYMELYPEDEVIIIGGAAAHLQLKQCGINDPVKDIDVNIWTGKRQDQEERARGYELLDRWIDILPKHYSHNYDRNNTFGFPPAIVTFIDQTEQELSFDIFMNETLMTTSEKVGGFNVTPFNELLTEYWQRLKDYKYDYDYMSASNEDGKWTNEINKIVDKHNRASKRLKSLATCFITKV